MSSKDIKWNKLEDDEFETTVLSTIIDVSKLKEEDPSSNLNKECNKNQMPNLDTVKNEQVEKEQETSKITDLVKTSSNPPGPKNS